MQFVFFTGGIVFLTLIINGSTTQFVLRYLGMQKLSKEKVIIYLVYFGAMIIWPPCLVI